MKILQIANYREGVGGISVQVQLLKKKLREEGIPCDILSTKGTIFERFRAIIRLLKEGRQYDLFHVHACSGRGFFPAIVGICAGRLLKKRTVLTYHGGGAKEFFHKRPNLVRFLLKKTSANIALSGFIGEVFAQFGLDYIVIPNIVELDDSHFRLREQIHPKFISTRTLDETYNIECTLKAFKKVQFTYPEASLTLLGDGPLRKSLEDFVHHNDLHNVHFIGHINNADIYGFLDQADIMISASKFDNMPVSILEGFNAGLLVVSSIVGGIPYMIEDGYNGLLFPSEDENGLSSKIFWALSHPADCQQIIIQAKKELSQYSWQSIKDRLLSVYRS